jgi:hypothetical protein
MIYEQVSCCIGQLANSLNRRSTNKSVCPCCCCCCCRDAKKLPFFLYAYIDRDIVVARGRSGGLAVWQRASKDWEAKAGVLAVYK